MSPQRPNVLLVCVDEMRAGHMTCMGDPVVQTPNLDRLAARGTLFRRSYCNNPICMPTRMTMLTGLMPRDHGLRINGQFAHIGLPTISGTLKSAGYRTHAAGKLHLTPWTIEPERIPFEAAPEAIAHWTADPDRAFPVPYQWFDTYDFVGGHTSWVYGPYLGWLREHGYERSSLQGKPGESPGGRGSFTMSVPEEFHYNRFIADSTIRLIEESAREGAPPFLSWCGFPDPHCPVGAPEKYMDLYPHDDMPLPARREGELHELPPVYREVLEGKLKPNGVDNHGITDDQWRKIRAGTYAMVTHLDAELGRILDALDRTGQAENTVIVFLSDHGDMMGDHGLLWKAFYTFQGCIRIPTIVSIPGGAKGQVSDELIAQVDLLPSILDVCGVPLPGAEWTEAKTSYERGARMPLNLYPGRSWVDHVRGKTGPIRDSVVIENDDPTAGFQVRILVTNRYRLTIYPGTEEGELFDLAEDPDELHNLWYRDDCHSLRLESQAQLMDSYARSTPWRPIPIGNA